MGLISGTGAGSSFREGFAYIERLQVGQTRQLLKVADLGQVHV